MRSTSDDEIETRNFVKSTVIFVFQSVIMRRWLLLLLFFFVIEHIVVTGYWPTQTWLDGKIPFCEWFVIPYCLWYPLLMAVG